MQNAWAHFRRSALRVNGDGELRDLGGGETAAVEFIDVGTAMWTGMVLVDAILIEPEELLNRLNSQ